MTIDAASLRAMVEAAERDPGAPAADVGLALARITSEDAR